MLSVSVGRAKRAARARRFARWRARFAPAFAGACFARPTNQIYYFAIRKFARFCAIEENTLLSSLAWLTS
jgi:hypothetical protein